MSQKDLIELLKEELDILKKATDILDYSYKQCTKIGIKDQHTYDELDKFESMTSRFARLSDIIIQKLFRLIDTLDLESGGSIRDRINRAEKKDIIPSAESFIKIRILRNDIAHEYLPEAVAEIFKKVLHFTPVLLQCEKSIRNYCRKFFNMAI